MAIIKLFTKSSPKTCKLVKADTYKDLQAQGRSHLSLVSSNFQYNNRYLARKASQKWCFEASRFALKSDGSEIEDEEVLVEILKDHPKGLELVALREGEEYGKLKNCEQLYRMGAC